MYYVKINIYNTSQILLLSLKQMAKLVLKLWGGPSLCSKILLLSKSNKTINIKTLKD